MIVPSGIHSLRGRRWGRIGGSGGCARLFCNMAALTGGGGEHAERGAEAKGFIPTQDARLGALHLLAVLRFLAAMHLLATLAGGGALLDPADAGAIGLEASVYGLEEWILQVNMARLFSSAGT